MGLLVHSSDLSNMTLPFEQFRKWGLMCVQEFDDSFQMEEQLVADKGTDPPLPYLKFGNYKGFAIG